MRKCVRAHCEKNRNAVIFKSLKYTVPSFARFKDSLIPIVPICWKHLSSQKRKVSTKCSNVLNVEFFAYLDISNNLFTCNKQMDEVNVNSIFYKILFHTN